MDQLPKEEELRKRTLILLPNQEDRLDPLLEKVYEISLKNDDDDDDDDRDLYLSYEDRVLEDIDIEI